MPKPVPGTDVESYRLREATDAGPAWR
jgi:hypothetical protein